MGLVTDVYWNCPGCGSRERGQLYDIVGDGEDLELDAAPLGETVKWDPPCSRCGRFKLANKVVVVPVTAERER